MLSVMIETFVPVSSNLLDFHPKTSLWRKICAFGLKLQWKLDFAGVQLDLEILDDRCNCELHVDMRKSK
jgi:hypothetical protein